MGLFGMKVIKKFSPWLQKIRTTIIMSYLLITDNINIRRLIDLYAQQMGLTVEFTNNGREGLEKIKATDFVLVLLNIQIGATSYVDIIKSMRQSGYTGKIVALTENAMRDEKQSCLDAGCNEVIAIPDDRKELVTLLERNVAKRAVGEPVQQPLMSSMELDDEVVFELVEKYVSMLPALIDEVRQSYEKQNLEKFKALVHDLKSTGGNYGYMVVTKSAARMELCLRENKMEDIKQILEDMDTIVQQIQLGWNCTQTNEVYKAINQ